MLRATSRREVIQKLAFKLAQAETGNTTNCIDFTPWLQQADFIVRELDRDGLLVPDGIKSSPATAQVAATTTQGVDMPEKDPAYEAERAAWIERHGSRRLRLAAERGYKHDGIYRDERLATDLPDYRTLRNVKTGELVNPTEEALEAEGVALDAGHEARLVWVKDTEDGDQGEAVEVTGYLGRHTVYLLVNEEAEA